MAPGLEDPTMTFRVKTETACAEGSYTALVTVYGVEFAVHYIVGEIRVYGFRYLGDWKGKKYPALAKKGAAARIAALGPEFAAAHTALYKEEA